ncbi:MAG: TolC family protein [Gemmatimonadota bacterium]|nr:TolC family protein [Gemmatimonadota bacterium]
MKPIRPTRWWSSLLLVLAAPLQAQSTLPSPLPLEEALDLARRHSPVYAQVRNDLDAAAWQVRSAYASWIPSFNVGGGIGWQGVGDQSFGAITAGQLGLADQPSYLTSSYSLSSNLQINGRTLLAPSQAKAEQNASEASVRSGAAQLDFAITQAYLAVLRAEQGRTLAAQELERARFNARLAQARRDVGAASQLDVAQAEVAVGRAQVNLLQSETTLHTARLRLAQGVGLPLGDTLVLPSSFELAEPVWSEDELYQAAIDGNPGLAALRANEEASDVGVRMARTEYLPSLSLSASIGGFARQASNTTSLIQGAMSQANQQIDQCEALNELFRRLTDPLPTEDCTRFAFTDTQRQAIESSNDVFPFDFTRNAPSLSLSLSLPVFQGLNRQRQVEVARVQRDDLRWRIREQELQLQTDIAAGLAAVRNGYAGALIEQRNQEYASEQLRLAQEQYRIGSVSFIDLVEAETVKAQADRALIDAVFTYHENLASLESLVGTSLRSR